MFPLRMVIMTLFYCCIKTGVTQSHTKALFPAASRINKGAANMANPTFCNSFEDVQLLFEILLTGIRFEASGQFSVRDAELASLRKTKTLEVICEEIIPRRLTDILSLVSGLSDHTGPLHRDDFERTLLTLVYITQRMADATSEQQRDTWAESFVSLYQAVKQDLTGTK